MRNGGAVPPHEIKRVEDENYSNVRDFLSEEYRLQEPLFAALEVDEEESYEAVDAITDDADFEYSYYVSSPEDADMIIALRLCSIHVRPKDNLVPPRKEDEQFVSPKNRAADDLLLELKRQAWKLLPDDINKTMNIDIIGVDRDYYRQGLARRLCEHNLDELKAAGVQAITSELTNRSSQRLFIEKLGYTMLHEIRYDEWLDKDGKPIFDCSKFPHLNDSVSVALVYKRL